MKLEEYIRQLSEACASPRKAVEAAAEKSGKKLVGWVAPYAPEEIIYAAGAIPVGLWGGSVELQNARTYLPPFACSIMQSILEYETNGTYDCLGAVLIPAPCDTLKCIGQKWKGKCPAVPFVHPQHRKSEASLEFLAGQYRMIRSRLEEILGVTITNEALADAISFYNKYRSAMREFTKVAAKYPQTITPVVRHNIIKASYFMDKADYLPIIQGITKELRKLKPEEWDGKRVVVTGITMEPDELLAIFDQFGINVAADDLAHESRQFSTDVPFAADPIYALAEQWRAHTCSLAFDPYKSRIDSIVEMARAKKADGVVIALMKFCDPEEYDVPILLDACKAAKIPCLTIEIDQQSTSLEQIRTRLQSFAENI